MSTIIPISRIPIEVRPAIADDLPFIDGLQKKNSRAVGFMKRVWLEEKLAAGCILVAESGRGSEGEREGRRDRASLPHSLAPSLPHSFAPSPPHLQLGYIIFVDRYMKHDDVGIVWQLNVVPEFRRSLVGAALVQAAFERAAYGCKLACLWCAQDLEANLFWESLGFVPLAFRNGSEKKKRVHIFWVRRVREGDDATPLWYPFQTGAGAIREERLVLPIPPGVHWRDVQPMVVPTAVVPTAGVPTAAVVPTAGVPCRGEACRALDRPRKEGDAGVAPTRKRKMRIDGPAPGKVAIIVGGRIKYIDRPGYLPPLAPAASSTALALPAPPAVTKTKRPAKKTCPERSRRIDPKFLAAARELRDRYLEQFNSGLVLPNAKYDVARALPALATTRLALPERLIEPLGLPDAA